jgi:hypothetical protein
MVRPRQAHPTPKLISNPKAMAGKKGKTKDSSTIFPGDSRKGVSSGLSTVVKKFGGVAPGSKTTGGARKLEAAARWGVGAKTSITINWHEAMTFMFWPVPVSYFPDAMHFP